MELHDQTKVKMTNLFLYSRLTRLPITWTTFVLSSLVHNTGMLFLAIEALSSDIPCCQVHCSHRSQGMLASSVRKTNRFPM
jgi:hypothetical protein